MIISDDIKVTTEILLRGALVFVLIDTVLVTLLVRSVKTDSLVRMKWKLIIIMALFFFLLFGSIVSIIFWDSVYSYVFPPGARWIIPPLYGILFSMAGLLFWWIATRLKKYAVITFLLLGGLWGVITHVLAIMRGILEKPPMLQGSSPAAALTIAAFEFIFYWCICLSIGNIILHFRSRSGK